MSNQTITPEEWKKADSADRSVTVQYAGEINKRVEDLFARWDIWAKRKWGPSGFASSIPADKLKEFQADKAEFWKFYEWAEVGIVPIVDSWRKKYSDVIASSPFEYLPGYWTRQYRRVIMADHESLDFVDAFDAYTYEKPSGKPKLISKRSSFMPDSGEPGQAGGDVSKASVVGDDGSVLPWLLAGTVAVWLFSRRNR